MNFTNHFKRGREEKEEKEQEEEKEEKEGGGDPKDTGEGKQW